MKPIVKLLLFYVLFAIQSLVNFGLIYGSENRNIFKKNAKQLFIFSVICSSLLLLLFLSLVPHRNIRMKKRSSLIMKGVPILVVLMLVSSVWMTSIQYRNWKDVSVNYFDSSNNEGMACLAFSFLLFLIPLAPILPSVFILR